MPKDYATRIPTEDEIYQFMNKLFHATAVSAAPCACPLPHPTDRLHTHTQHTLFIFSFRPSVASLPWCMSTAPSSTLAWPCTPPTGSGFCSAPFSWPRKSGTTKPVRVSLAFFFSSSSSSPPFQAVVSFLPCLFLLGSSSPTLHRRLHPSPSVERGLLHHPAQNLC